MFIQTKTNLMMFLINYNSTNKNSNVFVRKVNKINNNMIKSCRMIYRLIDIRIQDMFNKLLNKHFPNYRKKIYKKLIRIN